MRKWRARFFHPGPGELVRYAEVALSDVEAERVRGHVRECRDCGEQLRLTEECLRWLDATWLPAAPGDPALEAIQARLVAAVRASAPLENVASLSRLCLGPRSFSEIARRLRRPGAAAQPPPEAAALLFAAFLGRKVLPPPVRAL